MNLVTQSRSSAERLNPQFHDEFVALCALFYAGELSEEEWALLQIHMAYCDSCQERFLQYERVASDVIPAMAAVAAFDLDGVLEESADSMDAAEQRLMGKLESIPTSQQAARERKYSWRIPGALVAACLVAAASFVGIHLIRTNSPSPVQTIPHVLTHEAPQSPAPIAPEAVEQLALKHAHDEIESLQKQLIASEERFKQSSSTATGIETQLQAEQAARKQMSDERETLNGQLAGAQAEAESLRNRLSSASADTSQQATRISTLESKVRELNASLDEKNVALSEKDRMLDLDKDFLAHDRDIRDLIGARNLYIADISDTTENGKTAKQFGRIFYTKDRSLVFYGFDLDSQAGHKQDVSFQVWGNGSESAAPVSLGLFYQDDTRKRWVLRCNDAKTLARLDMVFVTAEPPGGSNRPTGKPLLRAYLQIEPNHP
jgi:hypothetical protein